MHNKFLVIGLTALSLAAAAQSQSNDKKNKPSNPSQVQSPRDLATGQASGRLEKKGIVHRDLAARDAATGQASGKKTAQDDGQQKVASTDNSATTQRVATADVNGDGVADQAASKNSAHATENLNATTNTGSSVQTARETSSGMASGRRQHQPVKISKEADKGAKQ